MFQRKWRIAPSMQTGAPALTRSTTPYCPQDALWSSLHWEHTCSVISRVLLLCVTPFRWNRVWAGARALTAAWNQKELAPPREPGPSRRWWGGWGRRGVCGIERGTSRSGGRGWECWEKVCSLSMCEGRGMEHRGAPLFHSIPTTQDLIIIHCTLLPLSPRLPNTPLSQRRFV